MKLLKFIQYYSSEEFGNPWPAGFLVSIPCWKYCRL